MNDFFDDEWALPWGGQLVHVLSGLDSAEYQIPDVKGALLNVPIMIASDLLFMSGVLDECGHAMFFE